RGRHGAARQRQHLAVHLDRRPGAARQHAPGRRLVTRTKEAGMVRSAQIGCGLLGLLGLLLAGCGGSKPLAPVKVKAQILDQSKKPLVKVAVRFHPQDQGNTSNSPTSYTDDKGRFEVDAIPGRYKITIATIPIHGGASGAPGGQPGAAKGAGSKYGDYE